MFSDDEKRNREHAVSVDYFLEEIPRLTLHLNVPDDAPNNLKAALKTLEDYIANESCWHPKEAKAAEALFSNIELLEVWRHMDSFLESEDEWLHVIVKAFLEPYAYDDSPEWRRMEAKQNIATYTEIAEKAHELRKLLWDIIPDVPGHLSEVDELINSVQLDKSLLKLLSLTTECRWPSMEYLRLYESRPNEPPFDIDADDQKRAESYSIYVESTSKKKDECYQLDGHNCKFQKNIYKRNLKYENRYDTEPPYDFQADHEKEIFLRADAPSLPKFQPLAIERFIPKYPTARRAHIKYLQRLIHEIDTLSEEWGRGERVWDKGPKNGTSKLDPIWLEVHHLRLILNALFPQTNPDDPSMEDIEDSQIQRELRK